MRKLKPLRLVPIMTVEESDKLAGKALRAEDCKYLIDFNADVYDEESGMCIAKFRKDVIPSNVQEAAYNNLLGAAKKSMNRWNAAGEKDGLKGEFKIRRGGYRSKVNESSNTVDSGIVGYFDRTSRIPYCRLTSFTQNYFERFKAAYPIIKFVDLMYEKLMPREYKIQRAQADKTSPDFVIKNTAFSTVTVNKNYKTAVHKDSGDFKEGFGNLVALRKGQFNGNYIVIARWGVGFDLQNGDLLLMDVHQWHGNTPMIKYSKDAIRLSLVMYYREKMIHCKSKEKELKIVKNRKHGKLN